MLALVMCMQVTNHQWEFALSYVRASSFTPLARYLAPIGAANAFHIDLLKSACCRIPIGLDHRCVHSMLQLQLQQPAARRPCIRKQQDWNFVSLTATRLSGLTVTLRVPGRVVYSLAPPISMATCPSPVTSAPTRPSRRPLLAVCRDPA